MYPANFFNIWPAFPRNHNVFVAMSFEPAFEKRWREVIDPAIRAVKVEGVPLQPNRVDARVVSGSIVTEILEGVTNDRLIFADITTIVKVDGVSFRNGNVMYELGLTQARRQPEEVLIFRSDSDKLLFDISTIRVNTYDPDNNPEAARSKLSASIVDACKEVDLQKNLAVRLAASSLSINDVTLLAKANTGDGLPIFAKQTMGNVVGNLFDVISLNRLLELNAVRSEVLPAPSQDYRYKPTPFGRALLEHVVRQFRPDGA